MSRHFRITDLPSNVNFGHSSRQIYDQGCYYDEYLEEATSPLLYRLHPDRINSCSSCLSVFGPRSGHNGVGASTTVGRTVAPAQDLVDVESVLSNRNVVASKCRDSQVNDIDVTKFRVQHARICNDYLDPLASRLTNPAANYRGMTINRFYNLDRNPQAPIFWNFAVNTKLEAKDNHRELAPCIIKFDPVLPMEEYGRNKTCKYRCTSDCPENAGGCIFR